MNDKDEKRAPRELKHCFASIHDEARKYEDWIITGLPTNFGEGWKCVELLEVLHPDPLTTEIEALKKELAMVVKTVNQVQNKIGWMANGSGSFCESVRDAWNLNANLLTQLSEYQNEYLTTHPTTDKQESDK